MPTPPSIDELLACVPQALARADALGRVTWVGAGFQERAGFGLREGDPVSDLLAPGPARGELERALGERRSVKLNAVARNLVQVRVTVTPVQEGALLALEPDVGEERIAFAQALQEIARAVGETLDVDEACAAAVVSMVRSAQVAQAEVFLVADGLGLRRVATSTVSGQTPSAEADLTTNESVQLAMATGQPQIGVANSASGASLFAAVPVVAQRRAVGVLVLVKARGTSFSTRELDLWSAAAGQLAVAVENGRLYREVQAALQIREDFMSIASHELKTPLTALKMGLHAIERRASQSQPVELAPVLKCKRQVDRLTTLVTDLLDATRIERGRLTVDRIPFDLSRLVLDVVNEFRHEPARSIELQVPAGKVLVLGDRDRIAQVVQNLVENAIKYSPLETAVEVRLTSSDGRAVLEVEDHGIGIPSHEQERVFERFYRARNSSARNFGGLGVGLYISRSVLELHSGRLKVSSEEGKGSTFVAELPLLSATEIAGMRRRVLVVDEDPKLRAQAGDALGGAGFDVLEARDPADALARLAQIDVDVVLASATLQTRAAEVLRDAVLGSLATHPISLIVSGSKLPEWATPGTPLCPRPYDAGQLLSVVDAAVREGESPWWDLRA